MATFATSEQLLVIIDPAARQADGESVRIAKDVLSAGAAAKVCLPEDPAEFARALGRRGARRPVVVGDDRALVRAVTLLHRERELAGCALSMVPVGERLALAESLGVPTGAVAAARAVLDGEERRLDLLADDADGLVLTGLTVPPAPVRAAVPEPVAAAGRPWYRSLVRTLSPRPPRLAAIPAPGPARLRVEVDGETVVELDQPVESVSLRPAGGLAEVEVRRAAGGPLRASGHAVRVSGPDFHYRADAVVRGPVRGRAWRAVEGAWTLVLPAGARGR